jgi:hypothetical protein
MSRPRDPIVGLLVEYRRVERALWTELLRHEHAHGCDQVGSCDLRKMLARLWVDLNEQTAALAFVALGEVPSDYRVARFDTHGWLKEYLPGPWGELTEVRP